MTLPPPPPPPPAATGRRLDAAALKELARERLKEAQILFRRKKYDGAAYLCGYAIELALKARICRTLKWTEYKVGKGYESFKTHDLTILLDLSGQRPRITAPKYMGEWSYVRPWKPEYRYEPVGHITQQRASDMIEAAKVLLRAI